MMINVPIGTRYMKRRASIISDETLQLSGIISDEFELVLKLSNVSHTDVTVSLPNGDLLLQDLDKSFTLPVGGNAEVRAVYYNGKVHWSYLRFRVLPIFVEDTTTWQSSTSDWFYSASFVSVVANKLRHNYTGAIQRADARIWREVEFLDSGNIEVEVTLWNNTGGDFYFNVFTMDLVSIPYPTAGQMLVPAFGIETHNQVLSVTKGITNIVFRADHPTPFFDSGEFIEYENFRIT